MKTTRRRLAVIRDRNRVAHVEALSSSDCDRDSHATRVKSLQTVENDSRECGANKHIAKARRRKSKAADKK